MKLYHITLKKYLPKILAEGLKINCRHNGISISNLVHKHMLKYYNLIPIFLTNDIKYVVSTMLTEDWIVKNEPVVLEIDLELNEKNHCSSPSWLNYKIENPKEFKYFNNIPTNLIKIINVDCLKLLSKKQINHK